MSRVLLRAAAVMLALLASVDFVQAQDWLNVQLNDDGTGQVQNEQQVVVNPTEPLNAVAVWRDFRLGYRQVGYGYTTDGGRTWTNPGLFVDSHYVNDSDPALTVSAEGVFYAMILAYTGNTNESNGLLCYRSTNGGADWEEQGFAVNAVPNVFEDKEFIACDRTSSQYHGRLYCVWDRFYETNIYCVASSDEGVTWTTPRRVSNASSNQFPTPAVGPDGTIYVAWTNYSGYLRIDKSTDGGITFGSDVNITPIYDPHPTVNGGIPSPCHPAMDIDISGGPYNGRIYVAYLNRVGTDFDIFIRHSTDGGATWSSARRINDDVVGNGRDQFHPWLTVDNTGALTAVWLDRRHDPANLQWYSYISQSFDGGMTWTPNQQVSTAPSDPGDMLTGEQPQLDYEAARLARMEQGPALPGPVRRAMEREEIGEPVRDGRDRVPHPDQDQTRAGVLGEYIGIASYDGYATAVWTDTRNGNQDTYAGVDAAALAVDGEAALHPDRHLVVAPNPASGPVGLIFRVQTDGWVDLHVFDVSGRKVRTLVGRNLRAGDYRFVWDGTDQEGRQVAAGAYYVRYTLAGREESSVVQLLP